MDILEKIRHALRDRYVTVVAQETGISYQTIRAIKAGKSNPTIKTVRRLADYLEVK